MLIIEFLCHSKIVEQTWTTTSPDNGIESGVVEQLPKELSVGFRLRKETVNLLNYIT